jgi:hypothetical protein
MNELHLHEPGWYGNRDHMYVGIAHFRLVDDSGKPKRGNIKIWIDWKVKDKNSLDPNTMVLAYRDPFVINCEKALTYKTQTLLDYRRTVLHIIPISDLKVHKERRRRTMPQDEFKNLIEHAREVKARKESL